ncbi:MAG: tetratricopeptide (TPR) repeat protein [Polyangiales bacterium]|jgi:tetratricopeptide (TPR) repeat protein
MYRCPPYMRISSLCILGLVAFVTVGCGARAAQPTTPAAVQNIEELHIEAQATPEGYVFTAFDAESLFQEGVRLSRAGECQMGLQHYDRVAADFPSSRFAAPSHYNAALCLKDSEDLEGAVARFEVMIRNYPESEDVLHARFQTLEIQLQLEQFEAGQAMATEVLENEDLTPDQRVEAMARQAQFLLGAGENEAAGQKAREVLSYARLRPDDDEVVETYFLAAANYVYAETIRLRAAAIALPQGTVAVQRPVLEERARLLLSAQREYFDTIRHTHAEWAAAAGYQIGAMYDTFWDAIMAAPVPPASPPLTGDDQVFYENEYRNALASLAKPLIRHSIRYWELTLVMVERTGAESAWTERIHADLERARERLLEQPEGPGGIPSANAPPPAEPSGGTESGLRYPTDGAI